MNVSFECPQCGSKLPVSVQIHVCSPRVQTPSVPGSVLFSMTSLKTKER